MADEEEDITTEQYYKLGNNSSIFHDPSQENGKVLKGQVVKLDATERVLIAFRGGHLVQATENQHKKYQEGLKTAATERAAKTAAAAPTTAAPATVKEANTKATQIIADAEKEAVRIKEQAEADAEKIKADPAKKPE